jgi:hypothetical protein
MVVAIHANEGDWGGAHLSDIEAVARSVADSFAAFDDDDAIAITLEPTPSEDDPPRTLSGTGPRRSVIRLNVRGNVWARLAYQFGHEYCHVLADPTTYWTDTGRHFAWIEEALCETGSLFALRSMAKSWAVDPPHPNWRGYSSSLAAYEAKHVSAPTRSLPLGMKFGDWLDDRLPSLRRIRTEETTTPSSPRSSCVSSKRTTSPGERCATCIPRASRSKIRLPDS